MRDGVQISAKDYVFPRSVYSETYEKALSEINAAQIEINPTHWVRVAQMYFVPLIMLYLFGWSTGWIRRGFHNPSS